MVGQQPSAPQGRGAVGRGGEEVGLVAADNSERGCPPTWPRGHSLNPEDIRAGNETQTPCVDEEAEA